MVTPREVETFENSRTIKNEPLPDVMSNPLVLERLQIRIDIGRIGHIASAKQTTKRALSLTRLANLAAQISNDFWFN
jgi:hypothetical protein